MQLPSYTPRSPKPDWLKIRPPSGERYAQIKQTLRSRRLYTVCEEARCPNVAECWGGGTATFMVLGDLCTRGCRFCAVKTAKQGIPLDPDEPAKVSESIAIMGLEYVVITSVDRDDLPDGGAAHFARIIARVKMDHPNCIVEVLTPDFRGNFSAVDVMVKAKPHVFANNIETVRRLTPKVRDPRAGYDQTLKVLHHYKEKASEGFTKSSIMLGLGETDDEILETMTDLRQCKVSFLTLGQYLQPTKKHLPVVEFVTPQKFDYFRQWGETLGFEYVASGPLVRSSYRAGEFYIKAKLRSDHGMDVA